MWLVHIVPLRLNQVFTLKIEGGVECQSLGRIINNRKNALEEHAALVYVCLSVWMSLSMIRALCTSLVLNSGIFVTVVELPFYQAKLFPPLKLPLSPAGFTKVIITLG